MYQGVSKDMLCIIYRNK